VVVWPKVFVAPPDAGGSAVLYYPARGAATVFAPDGPGTVEDCGAELTFLLGGSRAGILSSLAEAATTTDLARELGMSPGAISQHLRRLARAGLVNRTRVGRRVYYEHSDRGARLLRLFRESDA
jgi:DNA-binding transcriptional ArsR family regulator